VKAELAVVKQEQAAAVGLHAAAQQEIEQLKEQIKADTTTIEQQTEQLKKDEALHNSYYEALDAQGLICGVCLESECQLISHGDELKQHRLATRMHQAVDETTATGLTACVLVALEQQHRLVAAICRTDPSVKAVNIQQSVLFITEFMTKLCMPCGLALYLQVWCRKTHSPAAATSSASSVSRRLRSATSSAPSAGHP
jgi:hypothetical protein